MTSGPRARLLRFGVFELDLEARELRRHGRFVPLPPQPFTVLAELAARSGAVVPREDLRALLWGDGAHVDYERGLNHCLNRIRRVLGDDARAPRFVETLPRRGYRFLATVQVVEIPEEARPPAPAPVRASRRAPWLAGAAALLLALQSADAGRRTHGDSRPAAPNAAAAHAYANLAGAYMRLGEQGALPAHQAFPAARRAALAALSIADDAEPLVILAALDLNYDWDWAAAEDAYRRALRLDPGFVGARLGYARLLSAAGRHAEAVPVVVDLAAQHPECPHVARDAALAHYRARHFDEAARHFQRWARLEPSLRDPHHWLALMHHLRGQDERAVAEVRTVMALADASPGFVARFESLPPRAAMRFYIRGCIQYLQGLTSEWVTADEFARLRALLGQREQALRDLERAADELSPRLLPHLNDPVFDALRAEARFVALQRRVARVS